MFRYIRQTLRGHYHVARMLKSHEVAKPSKSLTYREFEAPATTSRHTGPIRSVGKQARMEIDNNSSERRLASSNGALRYRYRSGVIGRTANRLAHAHQDNTV